MSRIMVIATATGFLGSLREVGGPAFDIGSEEAFAPNWMKRLNPDEASLAKELEQEVHEFTVKHVPAGNWAVVDKEGNRASRVFKKDEGDAKALAQVEANRLNAGGEKLLDLPSGVGSTPTPEKVEPGADPTLPDA